MEDDKEQNRVMVRAAVEVWKEREREHRDEAARRRERRSE